MGKVILYRWFSDTMPKRLLRKQGENTLTGGKIDDLEPKKRIVVTPAKMAIYYTSHTLDTEPNQLLCTVRI